MDFSCDPNPSDSRADQLRLDVRADGTTVVVTVSGEVDLANRDALEQTLLDAIDRDGQGVVVDLSEVSFLDSSGVHAILTAQRVADQEGSTLILRAPQQNVAKVLDALGLTNLLDIDGDGPTTS